MKKTGVLAASVAAASATAITASSSSSSSSSLSTNFSCNSNCQSSRQGDGERRDREGGAKPKPASSADKFAPRFDGLRFIETLVTAHR